MTQLFEFVKMAVKNIRANKGRSILTMLGIIIGISSVIMIMAIGNGAKGTISDELNSIAGGQIYIYASQNYTAGEPAFITEKDIDTIRTKIDHVKGVTPTLGAWGSALTQKGNFDLSISGGNPDMNAMSVQPMLHGRYFDESDFEGGRLVGVIGESDAKKLFGTADIVGMSIEASIMNITKDIRIIGVRKDVEGTFVSSTYEGAPISMEMPYTALQSFDMGTDDFSSIYIISEGNEYSASVAQSALSLLDSRHQTQGKGAFLMQEFNEQMGQINEVLNMITTFISFVAAISLLVGGIGVMNIMLVSVTERTREIGIRKGLGARTSSILWQFLAESAIITAIGGIIGIILGIGGAELICLVMPLTPRISLSTILIATLFSSAVGIFFGIVPARKAANLSPIEALRRD